MEPKDKFAKPVMIEIREYVITFVGGIERVVRLTPDDAATYDDEGQTLDVVYSDGRQHNLHLKHSIDVMYRTYTQAVKPRLPASDKS